MFERSYISADVSNVKISKIQEFCHFVSKQCYKFYDNPSKLPINKILND